LDDRQLNRNPKEQDIMRRYELNALESLELKLSLTSLSAGGIIAAPAVSVLAIQAHDYDEDDPDDMGGTDGNGDGDHDPLPDPEPEPGPDPGDNPPIKYPFLPPSGPSGPGS
jgi:hypothetical protein